MGFYKTWALAALLSIIYSITANAAQDRVPASTDIAEYDPVSDYHLQCESCHGENGASRRPEFPILAGQHYYYLYVQLKDFKSGLRKNAVMGPIVTSLAKSQMKLLAKYFSEQQWPEIGFQTDPATAAKGETATVAGQCVQCHLAGYEGDSRIPRLAGQHPLYLSKTMSDFKHRKRMNSVAKSSLFVSYSDDEIKAMSEYIGEK
jgi:cytochrome c553